MLFTKGTLNIQNTQTRQVLHCAKATIRNKPKVESIAQPLKPH